MSTGAADIATVVGSVALPNPIMTAAGTSGHGTELAEYGDLSALGAVVVRSLSVHPWAGNPAPRVHQVGVGMLNSVGLQGPGLESWLESDLPALSARGARVVVSIWGQSVDDYGQAASLLAQAAQGGSGGSALVAVEVNVSCPNVEDRSRMFAHSESATRDVLSATECGLPRWAKLSPNVPDIAAIAGAALDGGAAGLTLTNTLLGAVLHPVAVRAVWECRAAFPDAAIIGAGGVSTGRDAVEFLRAGADAVQVGTAIFRDPRAPWKVLRQLTRWCAARGTSVGALRASARAERTLTK
jgi:dihydroorotate dehydrogenase (NAD+) catalytic subunit